MPEAKKFSTEKYKELFEIMKKREELGLNPLCTNCGRVMKTKRKDKYSGEYTCVCLPDIVMCIG